MGPLQSPSFCSVAKVKIGIIIYGWQKNVRKVCFVQRDSFDNWLLLSLID